MREGTDIVNSADLGRHTLTATSLFAYENDDERRSRFYEEIEIKSQANSLLRDYEEETGHRKVFIYSVFQMDFSVYFF